MNIRVFEALYIVATSHILGFWCSILRVSAAFFHSTVYVSCSNFTLPAFIGATAGSFVCHSSPISESVACINIGVAHGIRGACFKIWSYCR